MKKRIEEWKKESMELREKMWKAKNEEKIKLLEQKCARVERKRGERMDTTFILKVRKV